MDQLTKPVGADLLAKVIGSHKTYTVNFRASQLEEFGKDGRRKYSPLERREISRAVIARFHTKYTKSEDPDGCWLWVAGKFHHGYGMCNLGRYADGRQHTEYAHRVAYVIAKGNIPQGGAVLHRCDNPPCVNDAHLFLGTQAVNMHDRKAKGRYDFTNRRPRRPSLAQQQAAR